MPPSIFNQAAGDPVQDTHRCSLKTAGVPDSITRPFGTIVVVNPGDDPKDPQAGYLLFTPAKHFPGSRSFHYIAENLAPNRVVNGVELAEPNPTHMPRSSIARIRVF